MNLCPSFIHLRAAKTEENAVDDFCPQEYDLIDDIKIAHLKAIRAHTPFLVSIRLFACQNIKDRPQNYCGDLSDSHAEKKICESNKTNYVFFYADKAENERSENNHPKDPVYLVAFARYPRKYEEIHKKIIAEVEKTAEWLGIAGSVIQCYVFYTTNLPCNTSDLGSFKKKYDEQCHEPKYFFQVQQITLNKKPLWLNVTGGSPVFSIKIQEM